MTSALDLLAALPWPAALVDASGAVHGTNGAWSDEPAIVAAAVGAIARGLPWEGDVASPQGRAARVQVRAVAGEEALALVLRAPPAVEQLERVTQELAQAQHLQKGLLDSIPDIAWLKDADGHFLAINQALARAVGASSPEEVVGKTDLDVSPRELAERYRADDRVVMETRRPKRVEEPHVGPAGERWIETIKVPIVDHRDVVIGTAGVARDVTERRLAEEVRSRSHAQLEALVARRTEELARANDRLLQAQKLEALGRLAGGVAHDFNNLLTVIQASIVFAERALPPDHAARDELRHIRAASARAAELTRQLLSFARKQVVAPSLVDLRDLVLHADGMLRRTLGEDVELVTLTDAPVDPVRVDRGQFETVLLNLVLNARDAMPRGGTLTLEVSTAVVAPDEAGDLAGLAPGRWTVLRVGDTGTGIPDAALPHIFDPFFTTKTPGEGTGLGLATSYGIVRQAQGEIRVVRAPGPGTTFLVCVPSAGPGAAATVTRPPAAAGGGSETILLVEDEPRVRSLVARGLEERGHRVLVASSGAEALTAEAAHRGPIDLVVTDLVMPKMTGLQLATELERRRPGLPILFVSGYAAEIAGRTLAGEGDAGQLPAGTHFLPKPFTQAELAQRVRAILDEAKSGRDGGQVVPFRSRAR
jgi:PAS domain S-box-containing protein